MVYRFNTLCTYANIILIVIQDECLRNNKSKKTILQSNERSTTIILQKFNIKLMTVWQYLARIIGR